MKAITTKYDAWRQLPVWTARACNTPEEAARLKAVYRREGAQVRIEHQRIRAGATWIPVWCVIARKRISSRQNGDQETPA